MGAEEKLRDKLWHELQQVAVANSLDVQKFTHIYLDVISHVTDFLVNQTSPSPSRLRRMLNLWGGTSNPIRPISPIIIYGQPGTGKTTFLYLLDYVLRNRFALLPDKIQPHMEKVGHRTYTVEKRIFNGHPTSLLSVRKWADLLHFYTWDIHEHRFNQTDQTTFIHTTLTPMRVLFADEVEMDGYSPTIPTLAQHGLLVICSSNQHSFRQLREEGVPARLYHVEGEDMRVGNPADALVRAGDAAWGMFDSLMTQTPDSFEGLPYRFLHHHHTVYIGLNFREAVEAPLLETKWIQFFHTTYQQVSEGHTPLQPHSAYNLLFDDFSLDILQHNYNALIRFVSLFDAIEQLGIGVLMRNSTETPLLSHEALREMKSIIEQAAGVAPDIKKKTVIGIDRCASRIGQAGQRAHQTIM